MTPEQRASGQYGCTSLFNSGGTDTYDKLANPLLPAVYEIIIADGAIITEIRDEDNNNIINDFPGLSTGNWAAHAPIVAKENKLFYKIVTASGSFAALYTVKDPTD